MTSQRDLKGIDAAWIATDLHGRVAMFTTGGEGPVPESAIPSTADSECEVLALPVVSGWKLLVDIKRPDDFLAFASRGLFAYNWSDVHRAGKSVLGGYALQATPSRPLALADLPHKLQALASSTRLLGGSFGSRVISLFEPVGTPPYPN
jgi:hypothetical protein